ncbi:MAG: thioredoxin [Deltaproteobacteria bacterium]|nr:thioredoxin [Deltaproteobacteria bacterium]MBI3077895.1 thioredoxin [Deltaproteobacteria bacterium]
MAETAGITQVTDGTFDAEVLKAPRPALVDFWAEWCGPCKAIAPVVEELAREYGGLVKFVKLNVDDNPATPSRYGVRSIPTLLLFRDGQVLGQIIGAVPRAKIEEVLQKAL